eukprot:gene13772-18471_t
MNRLLLTLKKDKCSSTGPYLNDKIIRTALQLKFFVTSNDGKKTDKDSAFKKSEDNLTLHDDINLKIPEPIKSSNENKLVEKSVEVTSTTSGGSNTNSGNSNLKDKNSPLSSLPSWERIFQRVSIPTIQNGANITPTILPTSTTSENKYTIPTSLESSTKNLENTSLMSASNTSSGISKDLEKNIIADLKSNSDATATKSIPTNPTNTTVTTTKENNSTSSSNKTSNPLSATFQLAGQTYEEIERNLMQSIHESNQRRFRAIFFPSVFIIICILIIFGSRLRKFFTEQTADFAKETLENESLKIQTQELAMAVVQTILNDKDITAHAAAFLREASTAPDTQQALLMLTLHILKHPDTTKELVVLIKRLAENLSKDKELNNTITQLVINVSQSPKLKSAIVQLLGQLAADPEVINILVELCQHVAVQPEVQQALTLLLSSSAQEVIADNQVKAQSREFITDVMGDDMLQKEGGNALWNTVSHALKPGLIRITGFGLVCVSIVVIKVLLSPF